MLDHQLSSTDEWMFTASLHECNKYMFEEELATDLIFTFPTPDGSQVQVQAHRYILISRSPVFRAMLCGLMAPKNDVKVEDVNAEAFKEILRYKGVYSTNHLSTIALIVISWGNNGIVSFS